MPQPTFQPPFDAIDRVPQVLAERGYALVDGEATARLAGVAPADLDALVASWDDLPPDAYLKDGGRYRQRRHACFVVDDAGDGRVDGGPVHATRVHDARAPEARTHEARVHDARVRQAPHRAHWQPIEYNALHGGMARWFEPIGRSTAEAPAWSGLIAGIGALCDRVRREPRWYVEAHQFRIDTKDGIGRPTPEGAHRDGVDFVAVLLVRREGVKGGETRVFDATSPSGLRFTMVAPWTMLLLDDARVIHETTPIQPLDGGLAPRGVRDTLVITYRAGGFQGDNGEAGLREAMTRPQDDAR